MSVRPLRSDETHLVIPIGEAFGKEAGVEWDPQFFLQFWHNMYSMNMGVILGLFADPMTDCPFRDPLLGSLGALVTPDMFSGKLAATEAWWYVFPEHRNGSGLPLLDAYEMWAAGRGAATIAMTHLQKLQPEKLAKLYEMRGYTKVETNWRKEISGNA